MSDEKEENDFINSMRESPQSTIFKAFRHGQLITSIRLLLYLILSSRFFSAFTQILKNIWFSVERLIFYNREKLEDKKIIARSIIEIFRLSFINVLLSFLFVFGIHWISLIISVPPTFIKTIEALIPWNITGLFILDKTIYVTILTTIAGVTGVFLALYFTTLSLIAASYSEPHHREIRNLVINYTVSRGYLFLLAHLSVTTLFGLAFLTMGFPPNFILMAYVLLVSAIVIFSFFLLGRHIFRFLDPRDLVNIPLTNLFKSVKHATIEGSRSFQPSFQYHFQKQALYELHRIECLIEFALSQSARREIVRDLCIKLLYILCEYAKVSKKIPNFSMWFPRKRVYQRWGFTSSIQTDITMRTGTAPQPEEKPDYNFVFHAISRMIQQSLEYLFQERGYYETSAIFIEIYHTMEQLGKSLSIDEACCLLNTVQEVIFSDDVGICDVEKHDQSQAITIASAYGSCILNLAISASQSLEKRSVDEILDSYQDLMLQSTKQLYMRKHPREVLQHLEEFQKKLSFERKTEGRIYSSDWFLKEHLAHRYADFIWHLSEKFVQCITDFIIQPLERVMNTSAILSNAELLRSGIETTKKVKLRIIALSEIYKSLAMNQVLKEDWVNAEFGVLEQKLQHIESDLLGKIANAADKLTFNIDINEAPDYAGIFRAYLGDSIVSKMEKQDVGQFEALFASIFKTTFEIASRHIETKDEHFSKPHIRIAFDTILDLLDLSGLALLFSKLHGSDFYEIVKKKWDHYFDSRPNGKQSIKFFYDCINMQLQLPISSPSRIERFNWERSFIRALANAGFDIEGRMSHWEGEEKARTEHKSRIIQSIRPHMGMIFRHPYDYFAAVYLSERPEAAGIEIPNTVLDCKNSIERENQRREGDMGS